MTTPSNNTFFRPGDDLTMRQITDEIRRRMTTTRDEHRASLLARAFLALADVCDDIEDDIK